MVKRLGLAVLLLVALFVAVGVVMAQEETKTETAAVSTMETAVPEAPVNAGNMVCPVTGMKIAELGKDTVEYQGKVYNLCSSMCKEKFLAEPDKYVAIVDEKLAAEKEAALVSEAPAVIPVETE